MSDAAILLIGALLVFVAARGEEILRLSDRAKRLLGLLALLALTSCMVPEDWQQSCGDCHRDCGVLRSECHEACDAMPACISDAGDSDMSGVGGEDGGE